MNSLPYWLAPYAQCVGIAALVDHTLLKAEATESDIRGLCAEAIRGNLGAVCVNGQWVGICAAAVAGSTVRVAAVIGFPLGASGLVAKAAETRMAVADGAHEIDMVIALGYAKAGAWGEVRDEIAAVVEAARGRPVKAILETAALTPREAELACIAALEGRAAFVKTSTGFHPAGGATVEMVQLLRRLVGSRAGVKASGGIRTLEDACAMLRAGADRLGTSAAADWAGTGGPRTLQEILGQVIASA